MLMKRILFTLSLLVFTYLFAAAQKKELLVKQSDKGLYLEHKVAPKESFFSVGRLYNVHPRFLSSYNKLDINKGLQIDQKLRIPLTDTNFTQKGNSGTPVYYKVGDKEGLAKVSKANRDVLLSSLRSWNKLTSDELKKDSKLIIGFLLSKEMPSVTITPSVAPEQPVTQPEVKPVEEPKQPDIKPVTQPVEEPKQPDTKPDAKPVEEPKQPDTKPVVQPSNTSDQGFFKSHFDQQVRKTPLTKDATVTAGIFKTTSGWQDGKYYLLIDAVAPGTIIKIINPSNNKAVYAKVLGEMSGIRQNEGLNIRISNAAAAALGVTDDDKFILRVLH